MYRGESMYSEVSEMQIKRGKPSRPFQAKSRPASKGGQVRHVSTKWQVRRRPMAGKPPPPAAAGQAFLETCLLPIFQNQLKKGEGGMCCLASQTAGSHYFLQMGKSPFSASHCPGSVFCSDVWGSERPASGSHGKAGQPPPPPPCLLSQVAGKGVCVRGRAGRQPPPCKACHPAHAQPPPTQFSCLKWVFSVKFFWAFFRKSFHCFQNSSSSPSFLVVKRKLFHSVYERGCEHSLFSSLQITFSSSSSQKAGTDFPFLCVLYSRCAGMAWKGSSSSSPGRG